MSCLENDNLFELAYDMALERGLTDEDLSLYEWDLEECYQYLVSGKLPAITSDNQT